MQGAIAGKSGKPVHFFGLGVTNRAILLYNQGMKSLHKSRLKLKYALLLASAVALIGAFFLSPAVVCAESDKQKFKNEFGELIREARKSRDSTDDKIIYRMVLAQANTCLEQDQNPTATYFAKQVLKDCKSKNALMPIELDAVELLIKSDPKKTLDYVKAGIKIQRKIYSRASGFAVKAQGAVLIDWYLRQARFTAKSGDKEKTQSIYKKAKKLAKAIESPLWYDISYLAKHQSDIQKSREKLDLLLDKIRKKSAGYKTRFALVMLLLVQFDDPVRAKQFLGADMPDDLRMLVSAAGVSPAGLSASANRSLANWYKKLSESAPDFAKPALAKRELRFLETAIDKGVKSQKIPARIAELVKYLKSSGSQADQTCWANQPRNLQKETPGGKKLLKGALKYLLKSQADSGSWSDKGYLAGDFSRVGVTGIVVCALLKANLPADSKEISAALEYLKKSQETEQTSKTCDIAWRLIAFNQARLRGIDVQKYIQSDAVRLLSSTFDATYDDQLSLSRKAKKGEYIPTIYGQLALSRLPDSALYVPGSYWSKAFKFWRAKQNSDGSIGKESHIRNKLMYAAASACLLNYNRAKVGKSRKATASSEQVKRAMDWAKRHTSQRSASEPFEFGYFRALLCNITGKPKAAGKKWYSKMITALTEMQHDDGRWELAGYNPNAQTALGILIILTPVSERN